MKQAFISVPSLKQPSVSLSAGTLFTLHLPFVRLSQNSNISSASGIMHSAPITATSLHFTALSLHTADTSLSSKNVSVLSSRKANGSISEAAFISLFSFTAAYSFATFSASSFRFVHEKKSMGSISSPKLLFICAANSLKDIESNPISLKFLFSLILSGSRSITL
ncbi:unknown [Ruminococcus sp. CAG:624]|nr:unknown [Ruminococcus sp. CAG:624]